MKIKKFMKSLNKNMIQKIFKIYQETNLNVQKPLKYQENESKCVENERKMYLKVHRKDCEMIGK